MRGWIVVLIVLVLGGTLATLLWKARPEAKPPITPSWAPEEEPKPEPAPLGEKPKTIVRVRVVLPDGPRPASAYAWFRVRPGDTNYNYPARLEADTVVVEIPSGKGELSLQVGGCVVEGWMVDVPQGQTSEIGPYTLRRAPTLRGRVVDEDGKPVTNAFVFPKVGDASVPLTGTHDDGRFSFDGLPEGEAVLRVKCDTMVDSIVEYDHHADADPVEIVLERGMKLSGRVLDAEGKPVDSVYASVVDMTAPKDRARMSFPSVEDDGCFEVRLVPGRYRVQTNHEGRAAIELVEIVEGKDAEITLQFEPR